MALDSAASVSSEAGESRVASEPAAEGAPGGTQPEVAAAAAAAAAPAPPQPAAAEPPKRAPTPNAWDKPLLSNGPASAAGPASEVTAGPGLGAVAAQLPPAPAPPTPPGSAKADPAPDAAAPAAQAPVQAPPAQSPSAHGAGVLFSGGPDAFGPSLVSALGMLGQEGPFAAPPAAAAAALAPKGAARHAEPAGEAHTGALGAPTPAESTGAARRGGADAQQTGAGITGGSAAGTDVQVADRRGERAPAGGRGRGEGGTRGDRPRGRERGERGRGRGARGAAQDAAAAAGGGAEDAASEESGMGKGRGGRRGGDRGARGRAAKLVPIPVDAPAATGAQDAQQRAPDAPAAANATSPPPPPLVAEPVQASHVTELPAVAMQAAEAVRGVPVPDQAPLPPPAPQAYEWADSERGGMQDALGPSSKPSPAMDRVVHLSPALDPVAPLDRAFADGGGILQRPRSAGAGPPGGGSPGGRLANGGMPQLPADLSLGAPGPSLGGPGGSLGAALAERGASPLGRLPGGSLPQGVGSFGFPPPLAAGGPGAGAPGGGLLPGAAFERIPGVLFPLSGQNASMWQPQVQPQAPPQAHAGAPGAQGPLQHVLGVPVSAGQAGMPMGGGGGGGPGLQQGLPSFYQSAAAHGGPHGGGALGGGAFGGGLGAAQFGAFGSQAMQGLQFGQVVGAFGQTPFVPTGAAPACLLPLCSTHFSGLTVGSRRLGQQLSRCRRRGSLAIHASATCAAPIWAPLIASQSRLGPGFDDARRGAQASSPTGARGPSAAARGTRPCRSRTCARPRWRPCCRRCRLASAASRRSCRGCPGERPRREICASKEVQQKLL